MGNNVNPAGKILLIATGGTIACRETEHGLTPVLDGEGLLRELPELSGVCGVEVLDLMQRDSTDITADDRMQMARAVWENRGAYDGFVIAHGTDTLAVPLRARARPRSPFRPRHGLPAAHWPKRTHRARSNAP